VTWNNQVALFSDQPRIDSTGRLTFTPAPNTQGRATVAVALRQLGPQPEGESPGEVDKTATFTIEVEQLYPLQNDRHALDVNDDLYLSPLDALLIIDLLNGLDGGSIAPGTMPVEPFVDPSGDNHVSPLDALLLFNWLNSDLPPSVSADGEAAPQPPAPSRAVGRLTPAEVDAALGLWDASGSPTRRRKGS
jgi:hypothetical protein